MPPRRGACPVSGGVHPAVPHDCGSAAPSRTGVPSR